MKSLLPAVYALTLLAACAARQPDHFYILSVQPPGGSEARTMPTIPVALKLTLPSLVDRPEMILNTSAEGIRVLEHERWGAPLADLAAQTLARDIERRRGDVLVGASGTERSGGTAIKVAVDVVQMTVRRGDRASIEAHWRILDPRTGRIAMGGDVFSAPLGEQDYAAVAQALSECLGLLAGRLVEQMR